MKRQDIHELQQAHRYPCLTITLPTHRTWPDNRQDPIRVKNLLSEATNRLRGEFSKRELTPVLERLEALAAHIDYAHTLDGLVLAVNNDMAREYVLPFSLSERVVVDDTFFTRDLVQAYNRTQRYWVLSLSEQHTRFYNATREHLEEITTGGFPMQHTGPGGEAPVPSGRGINRSRHRADRYRHFFRAVDHAIRPFMAADPLPLAIAGVDRDQAFFREVSVHTGAIVAAVLGNYDHVTVHHLGLAIWPLVQDGFATRRLDVLDRLATAVGQHRAASTLGEVWHQAGSGRVETLVVEQGYHEAARLRQHGVLEYPVADPSAPDVFDDGVDEVITTVIAKGGRVVFVEDGELSQHEHIAVVLRY